MVGHGLFVVGITVFLFGFIWWIAEMVLAFKTKDDMHRSLMWIAVIVLNFGNVLVQIGTIIIKQIT